MTPSASTRRFHRSRGCGRTTSGTLPAATAWYPVARILLGRRCAHGAAGGGRLSPINGPSRICVSRLAITGESAPPNLLERLFGEARRRNKVIPRAFGEHAVLKLMYAALIRTAERWRGIKITEFEHRQLKAIREEIDQDFTARNAPTAGATVTTAPTRLSSNDRT